MVGDTVINPTWAGWGRGGTYGFRSGNKNSKQKHAPKTLVHTNIQDWEQLVRCYYFLFYFLLSTVQSSSNQSCSDFIDGRELKIYSISLQIDLYLN